MRYGFINNFEQILAQAVSDTATSITLDGGGSQMSDASADLVYVLTLYHVDSNGNETAREIVHVTGASGDTLTVTRAQEGTTAQAWAVGDGVSQRLTAGVLSEVFVIQEALDSYAKSDTKAVAIGQNAATFDPEWSNSVAIGRDAAGNATSSVVLGYGAHVDSSTSTSAEFKEYDFDGLVIVGAGSHSDGAGDATNGHNSYSVAVGCNAYSGAGGSIALGYYAEARKRGANAIGEEAVASAVNSTAMGKNAAAKKENDTAFGGGACANGFQAVAIGSGFNPSLDPAQNLNSYDTGAHAQGRNSVALGTGSKAMAEAAGAYGPLAWATGENSLAAGPRSKASASSAVAIGPSSEATGEWGVALGGFAKAGENGAALGCVAEASTPYSVAIGTDSTVDNVAGGMHITSLSYLPRTYYDAWVPGVTSSVTQGALQVVLGTKALDLTDGAAAVTLELPANTVLLIDSIDVVIVGSDTAGGSPEISVGPDDVTPAAYLASTPVGKTAVGGRESHVPLVADGVTSLRVTTSVAGTGTTYQAKIVFRGYVMEL